MKFLVIFSIVFLLFTEGAIAQDDIRTPSGLKLPKTMKQVNDEDFERRRRAMDELANQKRERVMPKRKPLTKVERKRMKEVTRVHKEDLLEYKSFLGQPKTGIFRLLPDFDCETKRLITIAGDCANFVPGRWAYSFRRKAYGDEDFHDIAFKRDSFVVYSLLTQGILVSLGDVSLENLSLGSSQLEYLVSFQPQNDKISAARQFKEVAKGIENGGYLYSDKVIVKEYTTYAFRIVAYRFKDKWSTRLWGKNLDKSTKEERKFMGIGFDKRNDSIFVFRIIRRSEDGIVTIIWKRLSKQKAPLLIYKKDERLADFGKK